MSFSHYVNKKMRVLMEKMYVLFIIRMCQFNLTPFRRHRSLIIIIINSNVAILIYQ